jgi:hypothetical protein
MEKVMPAGSDAGAPASASLQAEPAVMIAECLARLAANAPAEEMLARLRTIEGQLGDQRRLRARWLRANWISPKDDAAGFRLDLLSLTGQRPSPMSNNDHDFTREASSSRSICFDSPSSSTQPAIQHPGYRCIFWLVW